MTEKKRSVRRFSGLLPAFLLASGAVLIGVGCGLNKRKKAYAS